MGRYTTRTRRRTVLCFGLISILFTALFVRLGQLTSSDSYLAALETQSDYTLTLEQSRGFFYDCNLNPLVNHQEEIVYAVAPSEKNLSAVLEAVSPLRRQAVTEQMEAGKPFLLETEKALSAEGVVQLWKYKRYNEHQTAQHLLGYLSGGIGAAALEKSFDSILSAHTHSSKVTYTLNGLGQVITGLSPQVSLPTRDDYGVVLTIDRDLQQLVESLGGEYLQKGAVVVMDPYNGQIKAAASFPTYSQATLAEDILDEENTPMINRAFYPYSVGSTFKVVTAAAALEQGVDIREEWECTGSMDVSGQTIRCHRRSGHGVLDMIDGMAESCNPYFIHTGQLVGGEKMLAMAKTLGFGTGFVFCEGIKSLPGSLPTLSDLQNPAELANFSFGQGLLTATPVQVAVMMSAVCNGGFFVTPRLILGEYSQGTLTRAPSSPQQRVISADTAAQLQALLIYSVMVKEGQNSLPQKVTAGGKTATAQTGQYDEEGNELEHGWFAGFFPAAEPRYVAVILSEEGGGGNQSASPLFAAIADAVADKENLAERD